MVLKKSKYSGAIPKCTGHLKHVLKKSLKASYCRLNKLNNLIKRSRHRYSKTAFDDQSGYELLPIDPDQPPKASFGQFMKVITFGVAPIKREDLIGEPSDANRDGGGQETNVQIRNWGCESVYCDPILHSYRILQ